MPEIADGESVEMQGSGAKPYVLKNVGGVYSCSCPAWRNQSIAIERRTCKHLRKYRGGAEEAARVGEARPAKPAQANSDEDPQADGKAIPPILLAESWDNSLDLSGWWMSEKLDGVRAYWDGKQFLSRQGNLYHAPDWFIYGLPNVPLDGELWIDRKAFQRTVSIVRRQDKSDHWKTVRYVLFDAPTAAKTFEDRIDFLKDTVRDWKNPYVTVHEHSLCRDEGHLLEELRRIEGLGGEGLMLREPGSAYAAGRSATLLKVKTFYDAEATVVGHEPGKGRHQGRLGALTVKLPNGNQFSVGTGFSDKQREQPPPVGSLITFRYQELSDAGIPRFPSYVGIRSDVIPAQIIVTTNEKDSPADRSDRANPTDKDSLPTSVTTVNSATSIPELIASRYFEFIEGKSSKFWEIGTVGNALTTRWGRIGTKGQSKTKKFSSSEEAWNERNAAIESKLASGYKEIEAAPPTESSTVPALGEYSSSPASPCDSAASDVVSNAPDNLRELIAMVENIVNEGPPAPPSRIQLIPSEQQILVNTQVADELSKYLRDVGFTLVGDFTISELPVALRAFFRAPNEFAVLCEMGHWLWSEFSVQNADGTDESWSNAPNHDGVTPPWSKIVVKRNDNIRELYAAMTARNPHKEPAQLSADQFRSLYQESYARSMEWRSSAGERTQEALTAVSPEFQQLVWEFARDFKTSPAGFFKNGAPDVVAAGKAILRLSPTEQVEILKACFLLRDPIIDETRYDTVDDLRQRLLKKKLPFKSADIDFLAVEMEKSNGINTEILGAIEEWAKRQPLPVEAAGHLRNVRDRAEVGYSFRGVDRLLIRIDAILGESALRNPIQRKEVWAATAIDDLESMPQQQKTAWIKLLQHCATATTGKPSAEWLDAARLLIADVTAPELMTFARKWFPLVDKPWPDAQFHGYRRDPLFIVEEHQDILRGLVWCCCLEPDATTARVLGALGISAYRKIPNIGARAVRVGNACVFGLGAMADAGAVSQLAILKVKVKFGTAQRFIEQELNKAAERLGLPREELEEMSVPTYGLDEVGMRREPLGDFTAEVEITASGKTELRWRKADGSNQKSIPATVQQEFASDVKDLKDAIKDIDKMLPIQRERIDGMFLQTRTWPFPVWRDRYLDHPLLGTIARRIIWRFRTEGVQAAGMFHNGQLVDCNDQPIESLTDASKVELWHPIGQPIAEITAWRHWFERHEIQQPFKQAHREVYLLTDAEEQTRVYSNRFAAHILRQSQFRALASARGWQSPLLGYWDGGDTARVTRRLSQWNLIAEFWILGLPPEAEVNEDARVSAGMPHISTDQVRFCRIDAPDEPIPLAAVPPLVFSEIMRDVDLFVGVGSVGNVPNWADAGPNRQFSSYWNTFAFGDLSATARTRFEVLERLLPRLNISDRCELSDKYLVVRGDLRTYKIHLGSGNILMSPNDQYLCIVPKPSDGTATPAYFLPFEGDRMLSIILSKAFLLAADKKIKDVSITRQIASGI